MNSLAERIHNEFPPIAREIRAARERGEPDRWFEEIYQLAEREGFQIPWKTDGGHPMIREWLERDGSVSSDPHALVIGCGYGDDAELLAEYGYSVIAFDIAETAIVACRSRFPDTEVEYQVANLFVLPPEWRSAFDLVLESRTLQALPWEMLQPAVAAICGTLAPKGRLLLLAHGRDEHESYEGIPWPLARSDLATIQAAGLCEETFEDIQREEGPRLFRVTYRNKGARS